MLRFPVCSQCSSFSDSPRLRPGSATDCSFHITQLITKLRRSARRPVSSPLSCLQASGEKVNFSVPASNGFVVVELLVLLNFLEFCCFFLLIFCSLPFLLAIISHRRAARGHAPHRQVLDGAGLVIHLTLGGPTVLATVDYTWIKLW